MKDFDGWNEVKKNIDLDYKNKKYHAGDIWWCYLGLNVGFEQNGSGLLFERPVLIIKGFNKNVCLVVSLTTKDKNTEFYYDLGEINGVKNFAILSQIKLIDTKRLINKIGYLKYTKLYKIKKAIWELIR